MNDALALVFKAMAEIEKTQTAGAKAQVSSTQLKQHRLEEERRQALERARREAEKGGFFKEIADNIGLAGVAGLATFNYAVVGADYALHKTSVIQNLKLDAVDAAAVFAKSPELLAADIVIRKASFGPDAIRTELDKLGIGASTPGISDEDVKPITEKAVAINMLVAGAAASVLSGGSGLPLVLACCGVGLSTGAAVAQEVGAPEWVTLSLMGAGFGCSAASGFVGGKLTAAKALGEIGTGFVAVNEGTDQVVRTVHQDAANDARIDAQEAKNMLKRMEKIIDDIIDAVKDSHESHRRVAETIQGTAQVHNQTLLGAATLKG